MRTTRGAAILLTVALAMSCGALPGPARADMMSACAPEIGSLCSAVSKGRGRITACLISYAGKLGAACQAEVQAVTRSSGSNPLVPRAVRNMLVAGEQAAVPAACSADAGRLCSAVTPGSHHVLACLYAHTDSLGAACSSAMRSALN